MNRSSRHALLVCMAIQALLQVACSSAAHRNLEPSAPNPFAADDAVPAFDDVSDAGGSPSPQTSAVVQRAHREAHREHLATAMPPVVPPASRRVSVEVAGAPLEALMHAIAADAGLDLDLRGANASSSVTLRALDAPLESVLERVAEQVPFRWSVSGGRLAIDLRERFTASYRIDYLNIDRLTTSRVGLATRVGTIGANGREPAGSANHSDTQVENRSEHRFWASLTSDLTTLVAGGSDRSSPNGRDVPPTLVVNRDAGLVTLSGPLALHRAVEHYVDTVNARSSRQVLIEATVVEVALSKRFSAGIDWRLLTRGTTALGFAQQLFGVPLPNADAFDRLAPPGSAVSLVRPSSSGDITATLSLLEQFGDVRILSKPRIIALTNQSSILKVVDNRVYFTVRVERQRDDDSEDIFTQTDIHTVPVGLVMHVTPFVTADDEVLLNVRPTLSRILGFVDDPNPELVAARVVNSVPEIQVREMESMLRVQSGDLAIIGGLMQDTRDRDDRAVPWLSRLPLVGRLFQAETRSRRQTELLVVLRPSVLPDGPDASANGSTR